MKNDTPDNGGPAFPIPPVGTGDPRDDMIRSSLGNEFAKAALQGLLARANTEGDAEYFAEESYKFSDAIRYERWGRNGGAS